MDAGPLLLKVLGPPDQGVMHLIDTHKSYLARLGRRAGSVERLW
jgi:hypothetical protein